MARTASASGVAQPRGLKLIQGRGNGKDSGGRPVEPEVPFTREAPGKPEHLDDDGSWLWDEVVRHMSTIGLLKPLDAASLEAACETFSRWREAVRMRKSDGLLATNSQGRSAAPWIGIEERASREFRAWCAEYGLTPAAEKNLASDKDSPDREENPFA